MKLYHLIRPLGALAYTALALAFLSGLLKFKFHVKWIDMKWHFWMGIAAVVFATSHLLIIILATH